jgi:hypothetical protein
MRPGAVRIGCSSGFQPEPSKLPARKNNASDIQLTKSKQDAPEKIEVTAVKNPDGSIAVAVFNPTNETYAIELKLKNQTKTLSISPKALQTIIIKQP